jgi:uncharacterized protein (TIGR00730 family)
MERDMPTAAIFGSATIRPEQDAYIAALQTARLLAGAGWAVMTGGYDGIMGAASQGAAEAGGHVIGVTLSHFSQQRGGPNRWVREEIRYETLGGRVQHLVSHADAYVVFPGGTGTLQELVEVWQSKHVGSVPAGRPFVAHDFWRDVLASLMISAYFNPRLRGTLLFESEPDRIASSLLGGHNGA